MPEPSDDERTSETPIVESPVSAESAPTELPDLADVFRAQARAEKPEEAAPASEEQDDEDEDESDGSEEEAPEGETAPEPAPTAEQRRPNRLQRTRAELERTKAEAEQHRRELDELRTTVAHSQHAALASLGTEEEWGSLFNKRMDPNQVLTYAEEERYQALHRARTEAATWRDLSRNSVNATLKFEAEKHGVTLDVPNFAAVDPAEVVQKLVTATEARVREESKDEIARLQADNQSLLSKLGGQKKDPGVGGRSAAGRADMPNWDDADPQDFFRAAVQKNGKAGARR